MGNRQAAPVKLEVTWPVQTDVYCSACNIRIPLEDIEDTFNNVNYHHTVHTNPHTTQTVPVPKLRAHVISEDGKRLHHIRAVTWSFAQGYEYDSIDTKIA